MDSPFDQKDIDLIRLSKGELVEFYQYPAASLLNCSSDSVPTAPASPAQTIYLMIPGNPGVAAFYIPFLQEVHRLSQGTVAVGCIGHSGHGLADHNKGRLFSLTEQVEHKVEVLRLLREAHKDSKLILSGHSLGTWVLTRLLLQEAWLHDWTASLVWLMPTVHDMYEGAPVAVRVAVLPPFKQIFTYALDGMLKVGGSRLRGLLSRQFEKKYNKFCADVISTGISGALLRNCLTLAREEFRTIAEFDAADVYRQTQAKSIFLYSELDNWAPESHYHKAKDLLPDVLHMEILRDGTDHGFVIEFSQHVAKLVTHLLQTKAKVVAEA